MVKFKASTTLSTPALCSHDIALHVTSLTHVELVLQVFRTEHYSHAINVSKKPVALGLLAIIMYTIAAVALLSCAIAHPGEIQNTLLHPQQTLALITAPTFPWRQIAFTGLLSTDFVIYIEVRPCCCVSVWQELSVRYCICTQLCIMYCNFSCQHCWEDKWSVGARFACCAMRRWQKPLYHQPLFPQASIHISNALHFNVYNVMCLAAVDCAA